MVAPPLPNPRQADADVDPAFPDRWSPRAFAEDPLDEAQVAALFEAARWAPSSGNEQPWLFVYARQAADRERFVDLLSAGNRHWAGRAPLLVFLAARRGFARKEGPNRHAAFDAGAAWMSLALQARRLGLHAHAMGGFDPERVYTELGLDPARHEVLVAIAVGRRAGADILPPDLQAREHPKGRRPTSSFAFEGRLPEDGSTAAEA